MCSSDDNNVWITLKGILLQICQQWNCWASETVNWDRATHGGKMAAFQLPNVYHGYDAVCSRAPRVTAGDLMGRHFREDDFRLI